MAIDDLIRKYSKTEKEFNKIIFDVLPEFRKQYDNYLETKGTKFKPIPYMNAVESHLIRKGYQETTIPERYEFIAQTNKEYKQKKWDKRYK